jgi:hypothetical protein
MDNSKQQHGFPSGGPNLWDIDGGVIVPFGTTDYSGAESVSAKLPDYKSRNLRVAFVGLNAHIWKFSGP